MRQSFRAEAAAPGLARRAAAEFAAGEGADADTLAAVALCVSEAVTNAVLHAYRERVLPGAVELEACRPNGYLCLGRHVRRCRDESPTVSREPIARARAAASRAVHARAEVLRDGAPHSDRAVKLEDEDADADPGPGWADLGREQ